MGNLPEANATRDIGIVAGFRRGGRWLVGRSFRGVAVIGNITVLVPEDADVHIGGTGIIGGFDHHDEGPSTPGAPRITITGFAACGTVEVERRSANAKAPDPRLRRAQRRLERKRTQLERKQSR